jgi:UDP-3-O-[3-hydroxymyristoyl] glucosamine N-acyltransferase
MNLTLQQLANELQCEFRGDADTLIKSVASPSSAKPGDLCFALREKNLGEIIASDCSAVIVPLGLAAEVDGKNLLISENPQYSFVQAMAALGCGAVEVADGIHPSAQVAPDTRLADGVSIGAGAVIEGDVEIGAGSVIGAGCIIERGASIGIHCLLHSRVTLAHSVQIGDRCILHSGVVIGADGFGLVMHEDRWHKIPQLGSVVIADDVEIGANTTIDRGALDNTVIEQGCKLDNQIMVAHNVRIGAHTAIAACVGISGSTVIGRYCQISGGVGMVGHITIADHVTITGMSLVTKDIHEAGVYSSGTPLLPNSKWRRLSARYKALDKLALTVAKLSKSSP